MVKYQDGNVRRRDERIVHAFATDTQPTDVNGEISGVFDQKDAVRRHVILSPD